MRSPASVSSLFVVGLVSLFVPVLTVSQTTGHPVGQINPAPGHVKQPDGTPALPGVPEIWVYPFGTTDVTLIETPSGAYELYSDAANVQWALDNVAEGGTVTLLTGHGGAHKVFYFGDDRMSPGRSSVRVDKEVTLRGATLDSPVAFELPNGETLRSDRAVLYGGGAMYVPGVVQNSYFVGALNVSADAYVVVEDLRFDHFGATAIHITRCTGAGIRGNTITSVVPIFQPDPAAMMHFGFGIQVNNMITGGSVGSQLSGTITIEANQIDLFGPAVNTPYSNTWTAGVSVGDTWSTAKVRIQNNIINNPGTHGVWLAGASNVEVWVENNHVHQRASTNPGTGSVYIAWGQGVTSSNHFNVPAGRVHIVGNQFVDLIGTWPYAAITLTHSSVSPTWGRVVGAEGNVVSDNTLNNVTAPTTAAITFVGVSSSYVKNNAISGTTFRGISLTHGALPSETASTFNTVVVQTGDLSGLTTPTHVYLSAASASNTVYLNGVTGLTIADFGSGNTIVP